jgi:hypothetical protein
MVSTNDVGLRLAPSETDSDLLAAYAPILVVWPEGEPGDLAPGLPGATRDFHPRPVGLFADLSRLQRPVELPFAVIAGIGLGTSWVARLAVQRLLPAFGYHLDLSDLMIKVSLGLSLADLGLGVIFSWDTFIRIVTTLGPAAVALVLLPDRIRRSRRGEAAIQEAVAAAKTIGAPDRVMTLDGPTDSGSAWRQYTDVIKREGDTNYPRTVYARAFDGPSGPVLQYWLFFFYNHWRNAHETDWEVVTIVLDPDRRTPRWVATSVHEEGLRRRVHNSDRPQLFVARGSHALYFEFDPDGYDAQLPMRLGDIRNRLAVGPERDQVAREPNSDPRFTLTYNLERFPDESNGASNDTASSPLWWLAFHGGWGRIATVKSPWDSGLKWDDPAAWVGGLPRG